MATPSSNIPYDPVPEPPPSPGPGVPAEFGAPRPGFYDTAARNSYASSLQTPDNRGSEYGSIYGLRGNGSSPNLPQGAAAPYRDDPNARGYPMDDLSPQRSPLTEKNQQYASPRKLKRKNLLLAGICCALVLLIAAVVVPVYFGVIKPKMGHNGSSNSTGNGNSNNNNNHNGHNNNVVTWGGDGSTVTKEDGTTFVYKNALGGYWVYDPANPLNSSAKAQSYTPALNEEWNYGVDQMRGVNIGGWLVLEPFISPALYEQFYPDAVDEWTLSTLLQARDGNLDAIENHYKTFITEEDFAMIAAAGLNWIRLPIAFWAIETYPGEPHLAKTSWTYFLKAIEWARKYGLRINLDFHALPGSQNAWNHSGKIGKIGWLNGAMGLANAQRSLDYIRIFAEFISQPEYSNVVCMFGIVNEPRAADFGVEPLQSFYAEAYTIIRNAGGIGAGKGPFISMHEGFRGLTYWAGFLQGADRIAMDSHPYMCFGELSAAPITDFIARPCNDWGALHAQSMTGFGLTSAGEWSNAINDCGLYLNAVGEGTRYEGTFESNTRIGSCDQWNNWDTWDQSIKDALQQIMLSSMDALQNYFFWTWKIGPSTAAGKVVTPFWSYRLAVEQGWAPADPRDADGQCARVGAAFAHFTPPLQSWQVGGTGAGEVPSLNNYPWPPASIGGFPNALNAAQYTATGPLITQPAPTFTSAPTASVGDSWNNADDTALMHVPVAGCAYPDPWDAVDAAVPACAILPAAAKRDALPAMPTPMPL